MPGLRWLQCAGHGCPVGLILCDRSEKPAHLQAGYFGVSLPSLAVLRVLPEHRKVLTGMTAVAPSSLGSHLQVPRVQFPGPRWGRASNHTCSQKRTVCLLVEVRALPVPCQLAATQGDRAELIRALVAAPASVPKSYPSALGFGPHWSCSVKRQSCMDHLDTSATSCRQERPLPQSRAAATLELQVDVVKGLPG